MVRRRIVLASAALALLTPPAGAQDRPFATTRVPELGSGGVRLQAGLQATFDRALPLSGLRGDLLEIQTDVRVGVGDRVEVAANGVAWQHMRITAVDSAAPFGDRADIDGSTTSDAGDFAISTVVRLTGDPRDGFSSGALAGFRLPIAGNASGLGRDVTDAFAALLGQWEERNWRVAGEARFWILGDPTRPAAQDDQGTISVLVELAATPAVSVGIEGRTSFGDEGKGNELASVLTAGARVRVGSVWLDVAYRRLEAADRGESGVQAGIARRL